MESPSQDGSSQRKIGRRQFLKEATAGGVVLLFGGCTSSKQPTPYPQRITASPIHESQTHLPEITQAEVQDAAKRTITDFNSVLGLSLPVEAVVEKTVLVSHAELERIHKLNIGNLIDEPVPVGAVLHDEENVSKMYINKDRMEASAANLSNDANGKAARIDYYEYVIAHEVAHWSAASYESEEIDHVVFDQLYKNIQEININQTRRGIQGAKVLVSNGDKHSALFSRVEEAEAFIIGEFVMKNRGKPPRFRYPTSDERGITPQVMLLRQFLSHPYPQEADAIKSLAKLRTEQGGLATLCRQLGESFGIPDDQQLLFSFSVFHAIDQGDTRLYDQLLNEAEKARSSTR